MPAAHAGPVGEIYELVVTLLETEPPVWRRLDVPSQTTLVRLHRALQAAMGWHDAHVHEFRVGDVVYGEPDPEFDAGREIRDDRRTLLRSVAPRVGSTFNYEYDLGDSWNHEVALVAIKVPDARLRYPRVVDGARACPPEDCGGPSGYERLLEALADPADEEHEDMLDWVGRKFDPERFDVAAANRRLRRLKG